jgi:hypothetical protein
MPCWRCSRRQIDPVRGPSRWRRGVVGGEQVLLCPGCSSEPGWDASLDACPRCGSRRLVKALGEVSCRACGAVTEPGGPSGPDGPDGSRVRPVTAAVDEGLARAVEEALRRRREA